MDFHELDGHKLHLHPDKVAQWKKTGDCYPVHIEIGVTGRCNQKCTFCALDWVKHHGSDIDRNVLLNALENMAKHEVRSVMFGGEGEPFMHKDLSLFIQGAKQYGLDVSITTNGVLFTQEKMEACLPYLSWIKFSVDAGNAEQYSRIHGTPAKNFELLLSNIKNAVEFKRKTGIETAIGTQYLMIPESISGLRDLALIAKLTQESREQNLDVLINNAAIYSTGLITELKEEDFDGVISTNLIAPMKLTQSIYPIFARKKSGTIININSIDALYPKGFQTSYSASKYGLRGFTESLKFEAKEDGVRVIGVYPGGMQTPMNTNRGKDTKNCMNPTEVAKIIFNACQRQATCGVDELVINRQNY